MGTIMSDITVNVSENGIEINNTAIQLPCDISLLFSVLGEAVRKDFGKISSSEFNKDELDRLNSIAPQRACYTWNTLGIHCHTDDGTSVNTISLRMRDSSLFKHPDYYPASMFSGTFTINGKPWLKALEKGEKDEDSTELIVGEYSVYGSRTDNKSHFFSRSLKYSTVELSLYDDDDDDLDFGDLFTK